MMNSRQIAIATMSMAFAASMASAHLNPSGSFLGVQPYQGSETRQLTLAKDAKPWSTSFPGTASSVVSHGEFEGVKLYWTNAWWAGPKDIPGEFADSGGTNPWGLINSFAYTQNKTYEWIGWNDNAAKWELTKKAGTHIVTETQKGDWGPQIKSKGVGAYLPTWRDGAEGAYTMIHDDIGAMSITGSIKPSNDVALEHSRIRVGHGMKVDVMDEIEWGVAREMVMQGHEILNHSWDHSSAAEQWQWHYHGKTLSVDDPALPKQIRGLVIDSVGTEFNALDLKIPYINYIGGDAFKPETLFNPVTFYVSKDYKADSIQVDKGGWFETQYKNTGKIKAQHRGWDDAAGPIDPKTGAPAGAEVKMLKVFCVPGWAEQADRAKVNIEFARNKIDENIYNIVKSPRFPVGKKTEYYCYPYDAYSNKTHQLLKTGGHTTARGGAKSGMPLPGDFFEPFRLDFDAFFMLNETADKVFPENPHQRLSLQGLVERIIKTKGYMIREFHATADVQNWNDANDQSKGGWWGGIPKSLYKTHFTWLDQQIDARKLVVFTPTEAVKYRLTRNAAKTAAFDAGSNMLTVTMGTVSPAYQDEISVIVKFDKAYTKMAAEYGDKTQPRYAPVKMDADGKAWSISINPFKDAGKIKLLPNQDPIVGITGKTTLATANVKFEGLRNGQVALTLPAGNYTAEIFNISGRKIASTSVVGTNGVVTTDLSTKTIGSGMFFLNVRTNGASVMQQKFVIK